MIKTITIFILTAILFTFSCTNDNSPKAPKNMIANFEIEGMVCEHGCKGVIEKEMRKINGITTFDIDFEKETAEVYFDQNMITSEGIINKVEAINDGIYKMTLVKETEQINAKEKLPAAHNSPVSVANYNYQLPSITNFIVQWIQV